MLSGLLPEEVTFALKNSNVRDLTEIRVRADKPVTVLSGGKKHVLLSDGKRMIADAKMIDDIIMKATKHSLYSFSEQLKRGYIPYDGGVRIGVVGKGVIKGGETFVLDDISSLNIRIPHEVKGVARKVFSDELRKKNYLIAGAPHSGKTTLIRDMLRCFSNEGYNCLAIDERGELAAICGGRSTLDVGDNTDVITGVKRGQAVEMAIKNMNPDMLFMEEVFDEKEISCAVEAATSGVNVVCSLHAGSVKQIKENKRISELLDMIDECVLLSSFPVGKVLARGRPNDLAT